MKKKTTRKPNPKPLRMRRVRWDDHEAIQSSKVGERLLVENRNGLVAEYTVKQKAPGVVYMETGGISEITQIAMEQAAAQAPELSTAQAEKQYVVTKRHLGRLKRKGALKAERRGKSDWWKRADLERAGLVRK